MKKKTVGQLIVLAFLVMLPLTAFMDFPMVQSTAQVDLIEGYAQYDYAINDGQDCYAGWHNPDYVHPEGVYVNPLRGRIRDAAPYYSVYPIIEPFDMWPADGPYPEAILRQPAITPPFDIYPPDPNQYWWAPGVK